MFCFQENGPYMLNADGTLRYNDLSWNQVIFSYRESSKTLFQYANLLYIETPAYVGFSRADVPLRITTDSYTAELNQRFLQAFMTRLVHFYPYSIRALLDWPILSA